MRTLALLAAALASAAAAQSPAPPARRINIAVSPAGQAVLRRYLGTPDPAIQRDVAQLRAVAGQMATLANAPRLHLARLRVLFRQQETVQADAQRRGNERTLAMLGELSEADRVSFLRSVRGAATPPRAPAH